MKDEHADSDSQLEALDRYLSRLQAGEKPDRDALLREHPQLASALDCLEALEGLAPKADDVVAAPVKGTGPCFRPDACSPNVVFEPKNGPVPDLPRDFGPYELIREIGRGGMGVVYEARQKGLDRSVAVKMILASNLASPELVRRFQAEAKAAARLRHSNIVHIHEVGQFHGQDFFAMEYIDGQSLADRIAAGPIDTHDAVRWVATVARAVDHLHQQNVVHRDIKPSNILLDCNGQPYVTDFGLAKVFVPGSDMTATGVIVGTPSYMAPEQASGRRASIGPLSDVYSLGAILYELLTGVPPFRGETALDTLMEILSGDPELPRKINPHIPRGLELVCLKCLAKEPEQRYASAADLADDLDRFASGEPLRVRPPTMVQRFGAWTRRQPALAVRLGALGLFYLIETVNHYFTHIVDARFHGRISLVVALWIVASVICQKLFGSRRWSVAACFAWGTIDSLALFAVLRFANGAASPLVVCYPLIIVGSSLWFRVRYVWYMTLLSLLSYGVLVWDYYYVRTELQKVVQPSFDRHVIFALSMVVLGAVVAYLVQRVRTLSEFYGRPV